MSNDNRFLIGVDGSEDGDEAFNFYAERLHKPNQVALLVYVVPPLVISSNEMSLYVDRIRDRSLRAEKAKVQQIKETYEAKMRNLRIPGKINIIYYSQKPGKVLCELAQEERCSTIVIGCRRNSQESFGPTADYVIRRAPCSVSVAPLPEIAAEVFDSISRFEECQLSRRRSSKKNMPTTQQPRARKISLPAFGSPPIVPELVVSKVEGGANVPLKTVTEDREVTEGAEAGSTSGERRRSSLLNVLYDFGVRVAGRKKRIASTPEADEINILNGEGRP